MQWSASSAFLVGIFALLSLVVAVDGAAADPAGISTVVASGGLTIDGFVRNPEIMAVANIRELPETRVDVTNRTQEGEETANFTGVLVWTLLEHAGGINEAEDRAKVHHTLMITGRDGFAVALSAGEIDPKLAGEPAIIAYLRNDQPLSLGEALQLVMPWDRHATRSVRDVVRIEVMK